MEELLTIAYRKRVASRFLAEVRDAMRESASRTPAETEFGEHFTKREMDIMRLLAIGRTNAEIAEKLYLSLSTIKNYTHSIYQKLGVRNRTEAIVRIAEKQLLD